MATPKFKIGQRVHYNTTRMQDGERVTDDGEITAVGKTTLTVSGDRSRVVEVIKKSGWKGGRGVKILSQPAKKTKPAARSNFFTWKPMGYWDLLEHITGNAEGGPDDDWAWEATKSFMNDYLDDDNRDREEDIQEAVRTQIEDAIGQSMARQRQWAIAQAIEGLLEAASVTATVATSEDNRYNIEVEVEVTSMLRAWGNETEGTGLVAWDPTLAIQDIKDLKMLCNILDGYANVYGIPSLQQRYERAMDRFEPDTGSYSALVKVADQAARG